MAVELKDKSVPYHCKRPFPIPHIHVPTLKKEVDRLVEIGVLEPVDGRKAGPWCAPSFIIPKKDGRVRWISDFKHLNKIIKQKVYGLPKIQDILTRRSGYKFFTKLDLTMILLSLTMKVPTFALSSHTTASTSIDDWLWA